jgi:hypothetical protein
MRRIKMESDYTDFDFISDDVPTDYDEDEDYCNDSDWEWEW